MSPLDVILGLLVWCLASVPIALALGWAMSRRSRRDQKDSTGSAAMFRSAFDTAA